MKSFWSLRPIGMPRLTRFSLGCGCTVLTTNLLVYPPLFFSLLPLSGRLSLQWNADVVVNAERQGG